MSGVRASEGTGVCMLPVLDLLGRGLDDLLELKWKDGDESEGAVHVGGGMRDKEEG